MEIIPAIDIREKKVVRLWQGEFDKQTIYSNNPIEVAKKWKSAGAVWVHIIDLDGALEGRLVNKELISQIAKIFEGNAQIGGGIRTSKDIEAAFECGAKRVILGTAAIEDENFLKNILQIYKDKIAVSIDAKGNLVQSRGWKESTKKKVLDLAKRFEASGLSTLIYTDIRKDGTLTGPNIRYIKVLLKTVKIPILVSGGISSLEDIKALKELEPLGLIGVIVGRALYEGKLDLKKALEIC